VDPRRLPRRHRRLEAALRLPRRHRRLEAALRLPHRRHHLVVALRRHLARLLFRLVEAAQNLAAVVEVAEVVMRCSRQYLAEVVAW
jgi:hypothetical protein